MAQNLKQLTEALRAGAGATARAEDLQRRMTGAEQLRATPGEFTNPWAALAANIDRQRGREQVRELQPQLAQARQEAAGLSQARDLYDLQQAQDARTYKRSREAARDLREAEERAEDVAWRKGALTRAVEQQRQIRGLAAGEKDTMDMVNVRTGKRATVQKDKRTGDLFLDGKPVKGSDWTKYQKPTSRSGSPTAAGFRAPTAKQQADLEEGSATGHKLLDFANAFKDEYASPASAVPGAGEISNIIATEAPGLATEGMEDRQKWWSDFKLFYELPTRHEMFGSALTAPEQRQWRAATINPNMNAKQIKAKLQVLQSLTQKALQKMAANGQIKGWNPRWLEENTGVNLKQGTSADIPAYPGPESEVPEAPTGGIPAPAGVDPTEWAEYPPELQQRYIEKYGDR